MSTSFRRVKHRAIAALLGGVVCAGWAVTTSAQELRSPSLVQELASLMTAAKLEAIALQDPEAPDRFIAAMLFPQVQLLMVTAGHSSSDYVKWQIDQKQYKEVYGLLQQSGLTETRLFFQDLGADGLPLPGHDSVDVMYERGVQTLFDGEGKNGGKQAYEKKLREADARYSRLLQLAIDALRQQSSAPGPVQVR